HLIAIGLTGLAVGLIMTPAALHRHSRRHVTSLFLRVSGRLLVSSMVPLALSLCLDFYLIGRIITGREEFAVASAALFVVLIGLWFVLPRSRKLQRSIGGPER